MRILIISSQLHTLSFIFNGKGNEYFQCTAPIQVTKALKIFNPQLILLDEECSGDCCVIMLNKIRGFVGPLAYLVCLTKQSSNINILCSFMAADALIHPYDLRDQSSALIRACINRRPFLSKNFKDLMDSYLLIKRSLSPREKEVLGLIHEGLLCDQIAERLGISEETVKIHRKNIKCRLGLRGGKNVLFDFKKLCDMSHFIDK